jgi:hypothetical protein
MQILCRAIRRKLGKEHDSVEEHTLSMHKVQSPIPIPPGKIRSILELKILLPVIYITDTVTAQMSLKMNAYR